MRVKKLQMLRDALTHLSPKPWDDPTLLHARISRTLGLPIKYAEDVRIRCTDPDLYRFLFDEEMPDGDLEEEQQ